MNYEQKLQQARANRERLEKEENLKKQIRDEERKITELKNPFLGFLKKIGKAILKAIDNMTKQGSNQSATSKLGDIGERSQRVANYIIGEPKKNDKPKEIKF